MGTLGRVYKTVLQSGAKGMRAVEIADKLGFDKSTVYPHLNSLKLRGLVESDQGVWRAKTGEQTIKPLEKEIVIELPLPKDQWLPTAALEAMAKEAERAGLLLTAEDIKIVLERLRETRTIKIKGKNVDDLDLEKLGNLIQQANEKASGVNLKGFLRKFKRSHASNP